MIKTMIAGFWILFCLFLTVEMIKFIDVSVDADAILLASEFDELSNKMMFSSTFLHQQIVKWPDKVIIVLCFLGAQSQFN